MARHWRRSSPARSSASSAGRRSSSASQLARSAVPPCSSGPVSGTSSGSVRCSPFFSSTWSPRSSVSRPSRVAQTQRAVFEKWNAFSRITVEKGNGYDIRIDASAATTITSRDSIKNREWKKEINAVALNGFASGPEHVLIIGPGGGPDVANALAANAGKVTGVEVNPIISETIMKDRFVQASAGLYLDPHVDVVTDEGRSFIRRSAERYDMIQASLVDTWAATAAGAFALTENTLYTANSHAHSGPRRNAPSDHKLVRSRWRPAAPSRSCRPPTEDSMSGRHVRPIAYPRGMEEVVVDPPIDLFAGRLLSFRPPRPYRSQSSQRPSSRRSSSRPRRRRHRSSVTGQKPPRRHRQGRVWRGTDRPARPSVPGAVVDRARSHLPRLLSPRSRISGPRRNERDRTGEVPPPLDRLRRSWRRSPSGGRSPLGPSLSPASLVVRVELVLRGGRSRPGPAVSRES